MFLLVQISNILVANAIARLLELRLCWISFAVILRDNQISSRRANVLIRIFLGIQSSCWGCLLQRLRLIRIISKIWASVFFIIRCPVESPWFCYICWRNNLVSLALSIYLFILSSVMIFVIFIPSIIVIFIFSMIIFILRIISYTFFETFPKSLMSSSFFCWEPEFLPIII